MSGPPRRILRTALGALAHYAHAVYASCSRGCRFAVGVFLAGLILLAAL